MIKSILVKFNMIPILLITNDFKEVASFIKTIKTKKDIIINIYPKKTEYSIEQIKEIVRETIIYQPYKRIYVLENFNYSSQAAQNAFLKTLEESINNIQFILTASSVHQLLPTIISRVKVINLNKNIKIQIDKKIEKIFEDFIKNNSMNILNLDEINIGSKTKALELLNQIIVFFRNRIHKDKRATIILKKILSIKPLLENNNLNPQLTIDNLLIYIQKEYMIKKDDKKST